jgi:hypothetical protein
MKKGRKYRQIFLEKDDGDVCVCKNCAKRGGFLEIFQEFCFCYHITPNVAWVRGWCQQKKQVIDTKKAGQRR